MQTAGCLYAASIELRHDCAVGNLSRKFPDLRIFHWCVNRRDIFQVTGPHPQLEGFHEAVVSGFGGRQVYSTPEGMILVTEGCSCLPPGRIRITEIISSVGVWDIPPIVYRDGWESWRVIAWSERSMRDMFAAVRKVSELRLVSMRPIENLELEKMMLMPASDIFTGLTDRQSSALLLGLRHGYYSVPSATDIQRLADGAGLSASTFSEHLRKAEARILQNLRPYLEAYALRTPGEVAVAEVRRVSIPRNRTDHEGTRPFRQGDRVELPAGTTHKAEGGSDVGSMMVGANEPLAHRHERRR
ncbi:MAG: helix-turn-helix domain-containing protein [Methanobacteriota archaeon]